MPRTTPTAPGHSCCESFEPGVGEVMVRNPDWWGLNGWPHNVDRIVHRDHG